MGSLLSPRRIRRPRQTNGSCVYYTWGQDILVRLPTIHIAFPHSQPRRFGGTDGQYHYNDTWAFDVPTRTWRELSCIGFIPVPREGHAAALVDDVMYVFGGRGVDGKDLGDLAAFKISSVSISWSQECGNTNRDRMTQIHDGTCSRTWVPHRVGGVGMPWLRVGVGCSFWVGRASRPRNPTIRASSTSLMPVRFST